MLQLNRNRSLILLGATGLFIAVIFFTKHFGLLFYENVDDPQYKLLSSPSFNTDLIAYPLFHILSLDLLRYLSALHPSVDWYDLYLFGALCISLVNFTYAFMMHKPSSAYPLNIVLFVFLIIYIYTPLLMFINMTRGSIILSASAILFILLQKRLGWQAISYTLFCLFIAFDLRIEAALLGSSVTIVLVFLMRLATDIRKLFATLTILLFITLFFSYYSFQRDSFPAFKPTALSEPFVFALLDRGYVRPEFAPASNEDSLLQKEVMNFFLPDKAVLTPVFLKRFTSAEKWIVGYHDNAALFLYKIKNQIVHGSGVTERLFSNYLLLFILVTLLVLLQTNRVLRKATLLSLTLLWVTIGSVVWYVKMEDRVLIPFLQIYSLIVLFAAFENFSFGKTTKFYIVLFMIFSGIYLAYNLHSKVCQFRNIRATQQKTFQGISLLKADHFTGDIFCSEIFITQPFSQNYLASHNKLSCFDSPYLIYTKGNKNIAAYSYADFIKKDLIKTGTIVLSSAKRLQILREHLHVFYNLDIGFSSLDSNFCAPSLYFQEDLSVGAFRVYLLNCGTNSLAH